MAPSYDFARARRTAEATWRARPLTLTLPLLVYALLQSCFEMVTHLSPVHLPDWIGLVMPIVLSCVVGSTAEIMTISAAIPAPEGSVRPLPSPGYVLRMTGFWAFVRGYLVRSVLALLVLLVVVSVALTAHHPPPVGHHEPTMWDAVIQVVMGVAWWAALSPYALAAPMFAIARGTRNSMYKASWRFTADDRLPFLLFAVGQALMVSLPSLMRKGLMPGMDDHAWPVQCAELGIGCVISFGRSWFALFYTALAWQVSGFDAEAQQPVVQPAAVEPGEYGVPGLRL